MNAMQPTNAFLSATATAVLAAVATPKVGLFTGAPALSKDTVLSTLTALAPAYTGYAEKALTASLPRTNANGDRIQPYVHTAFQPSDAVGLPIQVTGYYVQVQVSMTDTLFFAEFLAAPFVFRDATSALNLIIENVIENATVWGGLAAQF